MDNLNMYLNAYMNHENGCELKCYEFETEISARIKGCIYAHDEEEARMLVEQGKNDDIDELYDKKVENIVSLKKVDECD